jgi:hypothetical protein
VSIRDIGFAIFSNAPGSNQRKCHCEAMHLRRSDSVFMNNSSPPRGHFIRSRFALSRLAVTFHAKHTGIRHCAQVPAGTPPAKFTNIRHLAEHRDINKFKKWSAKPSSRRKQWRRRRHPDSLKPHKSLPGPGAPAAASKMNLHWMKTGIRKCLSQTVGIVVRDVPRKQNDFVLLRLR